MESKHLCHTLCIVGTKRNRLNRNGALNVLFLVLKEREVFKLLCLAYKSASEQLLEWGEMNIVGHRATDAIVFRMIHTKLLTFSIFVEYRKDVTKSYKSDVERFQLLRKTVSRR